MAVGLLAAALALELVSPAAVLVDAVARDLASAGIDAAVPVVAVVELGAAGLGEESVLVGVRAGRRGGVVVVQEGSLGQK